MFIVTNGKNYVFENPMKCGDYKSSTSPNHAKQFTFKQARNLLRTNKKSLSWIHTGGFYMVDTDSGEKELNIPEYSNGGVFKDNNSIDFDDSIIDKVELEIGTIIGLAAWDITQLNTYNAVLKQGLSFYDSALSDIDHARIGKRPPAHVMTKVDRVRNEIKEKRRDIKQSLVYIEVLTRALKEQWSIGKTKLELSKSKYTPYKGRTKYYDMMEQLLNGY